MKRLLPLLLLFLASFTSAFAQTYDQLWREEAQAEQKDLPKSQIAVLEKIVAKASKENAYGQLLASTLKRANLEVIIAPDSLQPAVEGLIARATAAEGRDEALAAVYNVVLGHIYTRNAALGDDHAAVGKSYYQKALAHPDVLAKTKATAYTPLLSDGKDATIFGDDLLNVIAREIDDWQTLADYYKKVGNREAACYALLRAKNEVRSEEYGDLPVYGEVAIDGYDKLGDATPKERYDYCTEVISRWSAWPRIDQLRNEQLSLTAAMIDQKTESLVAAPATPQTMGLKVRNLSRATLTITRLDITGDTKLNPDDSKDLATLRSKAVSGMRQTVTRTYSGHAAYDIIEDSLLIPALPVGVYLLELSADDSKVKPLRSLYRVTGVYPLYQQQPNETVRIAVVDLLTGQPKPHAKVQLLPYTRYGKTVKGRTLTTDSKGELVLATDKDFDPRSLWAYTETDKASPTTGLWGSYSYYKDKEARTIGHLYTDRQIYRPGQTVHAAIIVYERKEIDTKAVEGQSVEMTLCDANGKEVSKQTVKTDAFGTAAADFTLPTDGLTGRFTLWARNYGLTAIQVEEYKRPTFEVEFPEVTEAYRAGDTLSITGTARTYSGVPVQGAKVTYTVSRREALWWWHISNASEQLAEEETTTDGDGHFTVRVPLLLPEDEEDEKEPQNLKTSNLKTSNLKTSKFYNFTVSANVTDLGGESHEGSLSLPLGTKATAFSLEMKDKFLADSTKTLRFHYRNAAGQPIDGTVRVTIDGTHEATVKANVLIEERGERREESGLHSLVAICGTDTLRHDFIVFSLDDKRPVVDTRDWFYLSANEFPADGKPVYVQVGSSDPDQHILYSVFSGTTLLESGAIDQSNALTTRKFTYKKEYGDGILLTFAWVKNGQLYTHSEQIRRPMPDKHLKLTWKTFRDRLTPGQQEEWTLSISLPTGEGRGGAHGGAQASLMATLYDKSLDQLSKHQWSFEPQLSIGLPSTSWHARSLNNYSWYERSAAPYKSHYVTPLAFRSLNADYYGNLLSAFRNQFVRIRGYARKETLLDMATTEAEPPIAMEAATGLQEVVVANKAGSLGRSDFSDKSDKSDKSEKSDQSDSSQQLRENLSESAFFYPQLTTDELGQVVIRFRLPESVTTWRFLGLAHDKVMNYGLIEAEAVAQKPVMVSPNVPRFVREGDHATLTARLYNTTDKDIKGTAKLEILRAFSDPSEKSDQSDPSDKSDESGEVLWQEEQSFTLPLGEGRGGVATFHLPSTLSADLYIVRITAQGDGFNDGEQHYLPVLTNKEYVTTTTIINNKGHYSPPYWGGVGGEASGGEASRLTVEYTHNPEWLAIQALPYMSVPDGDNAISLATAYFANTLGRAILASHPAIKQAIELWQREQGDNKTLMSALEKNQDLKTLVLKETPWVAEADAECEQRQNLIRFFDDNTLNNNLTTIEQKLQKLQNPDGSFSWWPGMEGSPYMTMSVVKTLVRLQALLREFSDKSDLSDKSDKQLSAAFSYLSKVVASRVSEMKDWERKGHKNPFPSDLLCDYAYASALAGRKASADILYIIGKMEAAKSVLSIYGKANTAVTLHLYGCDRRANDHLKSLKEYTVYKEEMGRYFDTPKANYSWCDYRMPTQVAAIEALRYLTPTDHQTIVEMQRWLLQEKRTTMWSTPINCVEAVYAIERGERKEERGERNASTIAILSGDSILAEKAVSPIATTRLSVVLAANEQPRVKVPASETGWGAVFVQGLQDIKDIKSAGSGLTVTREVLSDGKSLTVGSRVKVRITIRADRDYDFVQVVDKRAACLEPVEQTSGYRNGCYTVPKDQETRYYFDQMAKGTHLIETEYYIDREGEYLSGTCTAQCAYAPEFIGRTAGNTLIVK